MLNIPWWIWAVGGGYVAVRLLNRAAAHYRRTIVDEFVGHLKRLRPDIEVIDTSDGSIGAGGNVTIKLPSGTEGTLSLAKMMAALRETKANTPEARRPVMEHWVRVVEETIKGESVNLRDNLAELRPRVVNPTQLPAEALAEMPSRPLGDTGLIVVYVIDQPSTVRYVTRPMLDEVQLDEPALYERALANLAATFSAEVVRGAVQSGNVVAVKAGDTYDAARILLVPQHLQAGESLVALVPDRDTLMLVGADGDSDEIRKLARDIPGDTPRLHSAPIKITPAGFSPIA